MVEAVREGRAVLGSVLSPRTQHPEVEVVDIEYDQLVYAVRIALSVAMAVLVVVAAASAS